MLLAPAPPVLADYAVKPGHGPPEPDQKPSLAADPAQDVPLARPAVTLSARASRAPFADADSPGRDADFVRNSLARFSRRGLTLAEILAPMAERNAHSPDRPASETEPSSALAAAGEPMRMFKCPHCAATLGAGASMCVWCGRDPSIP